MIAGGVLQPEQLLSSERTSGSTRHALAARWSDRLAAWGDGAPGSAAIALLVKLHHESPPLVCRLGPMVPPARPAKPSRTGKGVFTLGQAGPRSDARPGIATGALACPRRTDRVSSSAGGLAAVQATFLR